MEANFKKSRKVELASEIFEEYSDLIRAAIYSNISDYSKAEDVYQELFLSLVHCPIPGHIQNVRGYLYRAVKHDIIDLAKKNSIYRKHICRYGKYQRPKVKRRTPLDYIVETEEFANFFNEIEQYLSPAEGNAVEQVFRHEREISESAEQMGISKRSVSRYKCVALKKLRAVFNGSLFHQRRIRAKCG